MQLGTTMRPKVVSIVLLLTLFTSFVCGALPSVMRYPNLTVDNGANTEAPLQLQSKRGDSLIKEFDDAVQQDEIPRNDLENTVTTHPEFDSLMIQSTNRESQARIDSSECVNRIITPFPIEHESDISESGQVSLNQPPPPSGANPGVTSLIYRNDSTGDQTTWALADSVVDVNITVKGPFSIGDRIDFNLYKRVNTMPPSLWDSWYYIFTFTLETNVSAVFNIYDEALDTNAFIYGEGFGQVDAYYFALYKNYANFYDGLNYEGHFLWMWGGLHFDYTTWLNSTSIQLSVAEPGWEIKAKTYFEVVNGPMAGVSIDIRVMFDNVLWFDDVWWLDTLTLAGGGVVHPGRWVIYWTSYIAIPTNRIYGLSIGMTRGIFVEAWRNAVQIYHGGSSGHELHIIPNIPNQAPLVSISYPVDGQIIESSTADAYCKIMDANSPYDIDTVTLYLDGTPTDITSYYSPSTQSAAFQISFPGGYLGLMNITIVAEDNSGEIGRDTALVGVYPPEALFPSNYQTGELDVSGNLYTEIFEWSQRLTWSTDENWNITVTPFIRFTFTLDSLIHLIYGLPEIIEAGDIFTALLRVSSVSFPLTLRLEIGFDYYFLADGTYEFSGSMLFLDESWGTSIPVELGVDVIDLRYDIPEIASIMQALTKYTLSTSMILPSPISWLAELILTIDIIPQLKVRNSLGCVVSGTGCTVDRTQLTWLGTDMIGINCTADSTLDGTDDVELNLTDFALQSSLGMSLGVNLTLTGKLLTFPILSINVNQWMHDYLGITIPSLDMWLIDVAVPLPGSTNLQIPVAMKQVDASMTEISATETQILVTVKLEDNFGNPVTGASVAGLIGSTPYTATSIGSGKYRFTLPYTSSSFDLDVSATKAGCIIDDTTITIFIDPHTVDESPPQISSIEHNPETPESNEGVIITATITDTITDVETALLYYSVNSGPWQSIAMNSAGDTFSVTIPGQPSGSVVRYYIEAIDSVGHRCTSSEHSYTVAASTTTTTTTTDTSELPPPPGIPGFPAIAIVIGVCTASGVAILVRRRKQFN